MSTQSTQAEVCQYSRASYSYIVPESLFPRLNITEDGLTHTWMCAGGPSFVMLGQIALEHLYSAYNCASLTVACDTS